MMLEIRMAYPEEHPMISQIARGHPCTRDFTNHIFSGEAAYSKGWIRVAQLLKEPINLEGPVVAEVGDIVGFTCVRHKVRTPVTELYFIGVRADDQHDGIGEALLADLWEQTPHPTIGLNCIKSNRPANRFYLKHGFERVGESLGGEGWRYERTKS